MILIPQIPTARTGFINDGRQDLYELSRIFTTSRMLPSDAEPAVVEAYTIPDEAK